MGDDIEAGIFGLAILQAAVDVFDDDDGGVNDAEIDGANRDKVRSGR